MREASTGPSEEQRRSLLKVGLALEAITLGWNVVGAGIVLWAAWAAGSVALAGFGLDSLLEIGASVVVIWQLRDVGVRAREQRALRCIALAFFGLAVYIGAQSLRTLWLGVHAATSAWGVGWLALTFVVMLALAAGKRATGQRLGNAVLRTEARVTLVDAYLAGSVLLGLLLNARLGWWWADPVAGLVIVFYGWREGWHAWLEGSTRAPARTTI